MYVGYNTNGCGDGEIPQIPPPRQFPSLVAARLPVIDSAEFRRRYIRELEPLHGAEVLGGLLVAPLYWIAEDVAGVALGNVGAAQGDVCLGVDESLGVDEHHREEHVRASFPQLT